MEATQLHLIELHSQMVYLADKLVNRKLAGILQPNRKFWYSEQIRGKSKEYSDSKFSFETAYIVDV